MSVIQVAFDIPPAIQKGIDEGTLIRYGGVVRDTLGHVVKHLDEVPVSKKKNSVNKIIEFAKKNKNFLIGTVIVTAIAGITYVVVKNKKNEEVKIPKCVADFNESFMRYIDAIKNGTVDEAKIDDVMKSLDEIKKNQKKGNIDITFSIENAKLLLDMVRSYTIRFAEANSYEIAESLEKQNEINSLQQYLKIQKQVFKKCA